MKKTRKRSSSATVLARTNRAKLAKKGVSVDKSGRARRRGQVLSASQVRRAIATIKAAVSRKPEKTTMRSKRTQPRSKGTRTIAPTLSKAMRPAKRPPSAPIAKKLPSSATSATLSKTMRTAKRPPSAPIAKLVPGTRTPAKPAKKSAAAKARTARARRAAKARQQLEERLIAQEKAQRKLARQLRARSAEAAELRKEIAKLAKKAAPTPAPPPALPVDVRAEAKEAPPPARPVAAPAVPAVVRKPGMTDEQLLAAEVTAEEAARAAASGKVAPPTPFEVMVRDMIARGEVPTPEKIRQLEVAALASAEGAGAEEASDADHAIANAYANLTQEEQLAWARAKDASGRARLSEAAKKIIRQHAIEKAIEHRKIKDLIDMRKSPLFHDDMQLRMMMRALGPLAGRRSITYEEARDLIADHLRTKDKFAQYRDEINAFLASVRPTSDIIQDAIKDAVSDAERQKILEQLIPELAKRFPHLDVRELWAMAKSPQYVSAVI